MPLIATQAILLGQSDRRCGVTEAACKTLVKQRLSQSGMRWSLDSIDNVLLIRGLVLTQGRWCQAWNFYDKKNQKDTSW